VGGWGGGFEGGEGRGLGSEKGNAICRIAEKCRMEGGRQRQRRKGGVSEAGKKKPIHLVWQVSCEYQHPMFRSEIRAWLHRIQTKSFALVSKELVLLFKAESISFEHMQHDMNRYRVNASHIINAEFDCCRIASFSPSASQSIFKT
jgi:hypothetical protein